MEHPLETIAPEEEAGIKKLLKLQMMFMKADETRRGQHGKSHGCVRARFRVRAELPAELRVGLFQAAGEYAGLIRFSNGGGKDDTGKDAHGLALKLLGVAGEKVITTHTAPTQDFVLADCPVFFARNPGDLAEFMQAQIKARGGPPEAWFAEHPFEAAIFRDRFLAHADASPLVMTYYSQTPYALGNLAVKYRIQAAAENGPRTGPGTGADYLRANLATALATASARFEFAVQIARDANTEPVEDPTIEWKTPFVVVADLEIPAQTFDTPAVRAFDENLSFSPSQALVLHRPLGGINRARRIVYESSARKRHETNQVALAEPTEQDLSAVYR